MSPGGFSRRFRAHLERQLTFIAILAGVPLGSIALALYATLPVHVGVYVRTGSTMLSTGPVAITAAEWGLQIGWLILLIPQWAAVKAYLEARAR